MGKWTEIPLPETTFDAVHTCYGTKPKAERIVMEGSVAEGKVSIEISIGNLKEATWLSPLRHNETEGCVYVVSHKDSDIDVKIPIAEDAPFLEDTYCEKSILCDNVNGKLNIALRLNAENRADFGEIIRFTLIND